MITTSYILITATVLTLNGRPAFRMRDEPVADSGPYTTQVECEGAAQALNQFMPPPSVDAAGKYVEQKEVYCKPQKCYTDTSNSKVVRASGRPAHHVAPIKHPTHKRSKKAVDKRRSR